MQVVPLFMAMSLICRRLKVGRGISSLPMLYLRELMKSGQNSIHAIIILIHMDYAILMFLDGGRILMALMRQ